MPLDEAPQVIELARGQSATFDLTFALPVGTLDLADEITLSFRRAEGEAASLALRLSQGHITVTGDDTAEAQLGIADSPLLPLGRLHWDVWLALSTGEAYPTQEGIAIVRPANVPPVAP